MCCPRFGHALFFCVLSGFASTFDGHELRLRALLFAEGTRGKAQRKDGCEVSLSKQNRFSTVEQTRTTNPKEREWQMAKFYCKNCGASFSSVQALTGQSCPRHPDGFCKGKHELYEGDEKDSYTCEYCGQSFRTIQAMTGQSCPRHPDGFCKGKHSPSR